MPDIPDLNDEEMALLDEVWQEKSWEPKQSDSLPDVPGTGLDLSLEDDGHSLAGIYRELFTLLAAAGLDVPDDEVAEANDELKATGFRVYHGEDAWMIDSGVRLSLMLSAEDWTQHTGKRGGTFWVRKGHDPNDPSSHVYAKQNPGGLAAHTMAPSEYFRAVGGDIMDEKSFPSVYDEHARATKKAAAEGKAVHPEAAKTHGTDRMLKKSPLPPHSSAGTTTRDLLHKQIAAANLPADLHAKYAAAVSEVTARIPDKAHELIQQKLKGARFYKDNASMSEGVWEDCIASQPWHVTVGDKVFSFLGGRKARKEMFMAGSPLIAAAYVNTSSTLHLDGEGILPGPVGLGSSKTMDQAHVYAHELGHAIDGPDREHSGSKEWKQCWQQEIATKEERLTDYAATRPEEGFAEMARAVYGGGMDQEEIRSKLPACSKYFEDNGLWPTH